MINNQIDPHFKCFQIADPHLKETPEMIRKHDEFVEWLHTHSEEWNGDESGIMFDDQLDEHGSKIMAVPGDYITDIPDASRACGRRMVRLPANGRRMIPCQMGLGIVAMYVWPLPNGTGVYLKDMTTPTLVVLSVDEQVRRGTWVPGQPIEMEERKERIKK